MQRAHVVVQEAQRRVVNDIGRHGECIAALQFGGHDAFDGVVCEPDLLAVSILDMTLPTGKETHNVVVDFDIHGVAIDHAPDLGIVGPRDRFLENMCLVVRRPGQNLVEIRQICLVVGVDNPDDIVQPTAIGN
jgi:hypothetical protein